MNANALQISLLSVGGLFWTNCQINKYIKSYPPPLERNDGFLKWGTQKSFKIADEKFESGIPTF